MSDLLRVTGMYSGIDTESIVSQLVSAKSQKVTTLKNEQTKLEWKQTAWQDLNSKIYNLYSKTLSNLRLTSAYSQKKTVCSDTTKATIVTSGSAVDGTQTLKVNNLAKSGYLTGAQITTKKTSTDDDGNPIEVGWETTDNITSMDSSLNGKTISITVGTGSDAKKTDIEITADMTINNFVAKLKEAGVNASFDETNQRFFISSKGSGASNNFTLSSDDTDALKSLGLDPTADYGTLSGGTAANKCVKIDGQDAQIELNGAIFTSDTNAFTVNGLTINVTGVTDGDEEISLVTSTDYDGIYDTIKNFLTEYNELINEIDKLYNADSARDYDVLSDEEKESMTDSEIEKWEEKIKGSLLRKDTSLYTIMNGMTSSMMDGYYLNNLSDSEKKNMTSAEITAWYKENGGKKYYLSDFGIGTLSYFEAEDNEHHAYHIDGDSDDEFTSDKDDKLKAAIANDPEGTAKFFAALCKGVYSKLDGIMSESNDYSSMYKVYNDKQLKTDYDNYTTKIKEAEEKLSDYEDKWYDKFSAMEVALSKLQSQSSSISSMLGTS